MRAGALSACIAVSDGGCAIGKGRETGPAVHALAGDLSGGGRVLGLSVRYQSTCVRFAPSPELTGR